MKKSSAAVRKEPTDLFNEYEENLQYLRSAAAETPEAQARVLEQFIRNAAIQAKRTSVPSAKFLEMCAAAREAVEPVDMDFSWGMPRQTRRSSG
jgi:hypothetical protein